MNVTPEAARTAFEAFDRYYAKRASRAWDVGHHIEMWEHGKAAFNGKSRESFSKIYDELRGHWQVFRGADSHWSAEQIFESIGKCDAKLATLRLSQLTADDISRLWCVLEHMKGIKTNSDGPAVVAVSKFLHFWNPRLFIIVDYGAMWAWVFEHGWIWEQIEPLREVVRRQVAAGEIDAGSNCDLLSYVAILLWGAQVMSANPTILAEFTSYITRCNTGTALDAEVAEYEAVALEWFLLGAVELPPNGVVIAVKRQDPAQMR